MTTENDRIETALDKLIKGQDEFIELANLHAEQLIGIIVWLMHKHKYEYLIIPRGHHQDAVESRTIKLEVDEEFVRVHMKPRPITYDEIVNKGEERLSKEQLGQVIAVDLCETLGLPLAAEMFRNPDYFELAKDICNPVLPAIDGSVV